MPGLDDAPHHVNQLADAAGFLGIAAIAFFCVIWIKSLAEHAAECRRCKAMGMPPPEPPRWM